MKRLFCLLLCCVLFTQISIYAEESEEKYYNMGALTLSAGTDISNQHFFRGIFRENEELILQPYAQLTYNIYRSQDISFSVIGGVWNSIHSGPTGSEGGADTNDPDAWFEADFYAGFLLGFHNDLLQLKCLYTVYSSPNNSFDTVQEISVTLQYNDCWFENFSLNPSVTAAFEIDGQIDEFNLDGGTVANNGNDQGVYIEVAISPTIIVGEKDGFSVTLSMPITAGFSIDNYYENNNGEDEHFGYVDVGLAIGVPLTFIPARLGSWEASASINCLILGDNTQDYSGGNSDFETIGTFGINVLY